MTVFPAFARDFELHPKRGTAFEHLEQLFRRLDRVDFVLRVQDAAKNQGQMESDFDQKLELALRSLGTVSWPIILPSEVPQELDFAFSYSERTVAVEVEKSNREKILRDILKCHIYLQSGADFAIVALPRNYPHTHGIWNLFEFGAQRFNECQNYGFGTPDKLDRILLLGFTQFDASTGEPLTMMSRQRMRSAASLTLSNPPEIKLSGRELFE